MRTGSRWWYITGLEANSISTNLSHLAQLQKKLQGQYGQQAVQIWQTCMLNDKPAGKAGFFHCMSA
jgi:hypothetical protein